MGLRGRRESVRGGLAAASMPRTPRKPIPPGHGQFPCASTTEKKEKIKSRSGSLRYARSEPSMARLWRTSVRGKLSKAGWVGWRGVSRMGPRHASGGLGRTPNPGLAVCAGQRTRASGDQASMDGFTASPPSDPPRQPAAIQLLLLLLLLLCCLCRCRAASPAKTPTSPSLQSPAGRGSPATAAASATPGSSHHAGPATAATPATAPPRCSRAHPRAVRR